MTAQQLRIVLVDDHDLFREGLRRMLDVEPGMRVVAQAATARQAEDLWLHGPEFDLALIDYQLDGQDGCTGLDVLHQLLQLRPHARVVMLTGSLPAEALADAQTLGASVFLKSEPLDDLRTILRRTADGQAVLSPKAALSFAQKQDRRDPPATGNLSARELLVLRLITEGLTNKEIGTHLDTTETNIKAILQRLFLKTGVRSRAQLVRYVFEFDIDTR